MPPRARRELEFDSILPRSRVEGWLERLAKPLDGTGA